MRDFFKFMNFARRLVWRARMGIPIFQLFTAITLHQVVLKFKSLDDEQALKKYFQTERFNLQSKYGSHAASFPEILTKKIGTLFQVEFVIDQRKCDLFSLIIETFAFLENSEFKIEPITFNEKDDSHTINQFFRENDLGTNSKPNIKSQSSLKIFKHGNIQTFKISFVEKNGTRGSITIAGEFRIDRPSFKFILQKESSINTSLVQLLLKLYEDSYRPSSTQEVRKAYLDGLANFIDKNGNKPGFQNSQTSLVDSIAKDLKEMGLELILPGEKGTFTNKSWNELGGYEKQKRDIEDTILLALTHSEIYDEIGKGTRVKFEKSRPKTVLFEGPPGTGKTTSAKIIASMVNIPLIYVPVEAIFSKWFGESEKSLALIFEKCSQLGKAIIFIDEIDSLAMSRDSDQMHEVSKRLVSTLLRKLDSFESENDLLLICATNRKEKLDPAILSRVDLSIKFDLPDFYARKEIFKRYAKQLNDSDLDLVALKSEGLSGRGILETCKDVERKWASKFVRSEVTDQLPSLKQYEISLTERLGNKLY